MQEPSTRETSSASSSDLRSLKSAASVHALDVRLEQVAEMRNDGEAPPPNNIADETAFLNIVTVHGERLEYVDHEGEQAFKKNDKRRENEPFLRRWLLSIVRGRAMPIIPLLSTTCWAALAVTLTWVSRRNYEPHLNGDCRWWCTPLAVDGNALSYVGFALFLLTSFRVSEAYGRYMEAVRVWTGIAGTVTSFTKYVVQAFPPGTFHRGDQERILGFLVAFAVALKRQLRGERDLRELKGVLIPEDLAELQNAPSMPSHCLYIISAYLLSAQRREDRLPQAFIVHLIRWVADLAGAADTCMQIKTMPAPYSYISHLNTFLTLWLFFLPFALVETTGWLTIAIVAFISYGILGVVSNAAELEDPFGGDYNDLPLGKLSQSIQDEVSLIYKQSLSQPKRKVVREVNDFELRGHHDYWLKPDSI
ncbi:unnamed protein product [Agarophyton chilense]